MGINDLLTNPLWLKPQFEYLLWLQNFRELTGGIFDNLFLCITAMGEFMLPVMLISLIYWIIDFEAGCYLFTLNATNLFVIKFLKMTVCIYRPWILDNKIHPIDSALKMAGGYSFPSGHTAGAVSTWGGLAFLLKKNKYLVSIFILVIILVAFSRNYVGVHTPQDIIASILIGVILIFATNKMLVWCRKDKNNNIKIIIVANILGLLAYFYDINKPYPLDYVNGQLLVNPQKAIHSAAIYSGWILGVINGLCLCRRFAPYSPKGKPWEKRVIIGILGLVLLYCMFLMFDKYIVFSSSISHSASFFVLFFIGIFITLIYPIMFRKYLR